MQGLLRSAHRAYSSWPPSESLATHLSLLSIQGRLDEACRILRQTPPSNPPHLSSDSYLPLIRACIKFKAYTRGREIHRHIIDNGVRPNLLLHNNLMIMYSKCGELELTRQVFDEMTERNLFSWTALIGAYANGGDPVRAFELYQDMVLEGVKADNFMYPLVLKSCVEMKDLRRGRRVHGEFVRSGFQWDLVIINSLIDMYAKCGTMVDARDVFYECDTRDVFTWTTLISGYVQSGCGLEALKIFKEMMCSDVKPRPATFSGILPLFSDLGCLEMAKQIHGLAVVHGSEYDKFLGTALIDMYGNCGGLGYGRFIFDRVKEKDVVCWNAMIKGYVQIGLFDQAIILFEQMLIEGISPNKITVDCVLPVYLESGKGVLDLIHHFEQIGFDMSTLFATLFDHVYEHVDDMKLVKELCMYLRNAGYILDNYVAAKVIEMYSKFADVEAAQEIFNSISAKDLDCWNAIIGCYAHNMYINKSLELFDSMRKAGVEPNSLSWNTVIAGMVESGDFDSALQMFIDMMWTYQNPNLRNFETILPIIQNNTCPMIGKELHCIFLRNKCEMSKYVCTGFINMYGNCGNVDYAVSLFESMEGKDSVSWNAVISCFAKNGFLNEASKMFHQMRKVGVATDIITWTTMISGYARNGLVDEGLKHFRELQMEGLRPNSITIASILPICAQSAILSLGKSIHGYIIRGGLGGEDLYVSNALIDMFVKCGCMEYAERVFWRLPRRDVVSWNTMIQGYAIYGNGKAALSLFDQMESEGAVPNNITFIEILNSCSHAGLINEGWKLFNSMESKYGIPPSGKHYACMVDILGRGGHFEDVRDFITQMPLQPTASLWGALLSACKTHKNVEMAEYAATHLIELQPDNPGNYVVLSNIYATAGRWNDVDRLRHLMISRGVKKAPGSSWIEIGKNIHVFAVEDLAKQEMKEIHKTVLDLADAVTEEGYVHDVNAIRFEDVAEF